jgi:hypothetical protein
MKNLLVLSLLLILAGCKFEAPLTEKPTRLVDPTLVGSWFSLSDGNRLEVYRLSGEEYLVTKGGKPYVCTHSDLSGIKFVSCRQLENSKEYYGKYAYSAYEIEKGELLIYQLNESIGIKEDQSVEKVRELIGKAAKAGTALNKDPKTVDRYRKIEGSGDWILKR